MPRPGRDVPRPCPVHCLSPMLQLPLPRTRTRTLPEYRACTCTRTRTRIRTRIRIRIRIRTMVENWRRAYHYADIGIGVRPAPVPVHAHPGRPPHADPSTPLPTPAIPRIQSSSTCGPAARGSLPARPGRGVRTALEAVPRLHGPTLGPRHRPGEDSESQ